MQPRYKSYPLAILLLLFCVAGLQAQTKTSLPSNKPPSAWYSKTAKDNNSRINKPHSTAHASNATVLPSEKTLPELTKGVKNQPGGGSRKAQTAVTPKTLPSNSMAPGQFSRKRMIPPPPRQ